MTEDARGMLGEIRDGGRKGWMEGGWEDGSQNPRAFCLPGRALVWNGEPKKLMGNVRRRKAALDVCS